MTNNKEKYYKLILFNNINESRLFILSISDILNKYDNIYDIDNINLEFNDNLCVCNIVDINEPKWKSDCNFIINNNDNEIININNYRLVIYKFDNLIYYIEKNGNIREINNFLKTFKYFKYKNFNINNINYIDSIYKLNKIISNYLLDRNFFNYNYKKFCNKHRIPIINYINNDDDDDDDDDDDFSYNNIINLSEDLINNKILDSNKKLNDSNLNNNENQYYKNIKKYNFLDLDNSDIYYDKENRLLFNYKTIKGYSLLNYQIVFNLILLKTKPKNCLSINFINKFNIDINNFKYVIGIIKNNDNNDINDNIEFKIEIGTICYFLNKLNIEYYIDIN